MFEGSRERLLGNEAAENGCWGMRIELMELMEEMELID